MNAFDKLMALGVAKTRAITGQMIAVSTVPQVSATVSPIRREEMLDANGTPFWVDAGDVTIGQDVWPANTAPPQTGQSLILGDGSKYRIGPVTVTPALISLHFTSFY